MPENLMEQAAQMVLAPLRADPPAGLIFDLSQRRLRRLGVPVVPAALPQARQGARQRGGRGRRLQPARELLHMTALDTLWALYADRAEAIAALTGD